ncbi:hypothetical protein ABZ532_25470 [Streptomyces sp. NPDC019396]|uniref:hypothetical protein n=1 Tax=Streptomyces sp. NPDC019396 TaxID=3154687 RepID=UPI0033D20AD1
MPTHDDGPTQRLRPLHHPGSHQGDEVPEYLSTGWTSAFNAPSPHETYRSRATAATVWNTGVYPVGPAPDHVLPTLPLPESELPPDRTTAVWRDGPIQRPRRPRRHTWRWPGWAALGLLLTAVAGVILWQRDTRELAITQVTVSAQPTELGCDRAATVVAVITTNGAAGTIRYQWIRSDGTTSGELRQTVRDGQGEVTLPMYWTFHGRGTREARAVVGVLTPTAHTASASFTYRCG